MTMRFIAFIFSFYLLQIASAQAFKQKLTEHKGNVESVAYSTDGKYLATGSWDGNVNLYTIDSMGNANFKQAFSGHLGAVITLSFSKNAKFLVSGSKDYS